MKNRRADVMLAEQYPELDLRMAKALIMEGRVLCDNRKVLFPGEMLSPKTQLRVKGQIDPYVSRGALKLERALQAFQIDIHSQVCIDVGSSTGGFTDVMLRAGAKVVYSVDVGFNLLDYRLRSDPRVICMERTNARYLKPEQFDTLPDFGATDVSFISLKTILPSVVSLFGVHGRFVALIKPQFEARKEDVGTRGVVRERRVHEYVLEDITGFIPTIGWKIIGLEFSPIQGQEGNIEFLLDMVPEGNELAPQRDWSIAKVIDQAYDKFIKSY